MVAMVPKAGNTFLVSAVRGRDNLTRNPMAGNNASRTTSLVFLPIAYQLSLSEPYFA
jgi:hypothetical protein